MNERQTNFFPFFLNKPEEFHAHKIFFMCVWTEEKKENFHLYCTLQYFPLPFYFALS